MTTELPLVRGVRVGDGAVVRVVEGRPDAVRADHMVTETYLDHDD